MADSRLPIKIEYDDAQAVINERSSLTPGLDFHRSRFQAWKKSFDELLKNRHRLPRPAGHNVSVLSTSAQRLGSLGGSVMACNNAASQPSSRRDAAKQERILEANTAAPNVSDGSSTRMRQQSNTVTEISTVSDSPLKSSSVRSEEVLPRTRDISNRGIRPSHSTNIQTEKMETTPVEIFNELTHTFRRVYAPLFDVTTRVCHDVEDFEKQFPVVRDGILKTMQNKYGERLTQNMIILFRSFASVYHLKADVVNKVRRRKNQIIEELIWERLNEIQQDLTKLICVTGSFEDMKEVYENDDPCRIAMLKALGEKYATEYVKMKKERLDGIFRVIRQMKEYQNIIVSCLEDDVCCQDIHLVTYHNKAEAATGLGSNPGQQVPMFEGKMKEMLENVRSSLKKKNEQRIEGEFKIARQAVQYAGTKYCELLESQPKTTVTAQRLKELHDSTTTAILECFYGVPDFIYSYPWKAKKLELVESLEKEYAEITKRNEANIKLKEAALESAIEERITTVRRAVMQLLSEDKDERDFSRELDDLIAKSVATFKSRFPAANSAAVSKLKNRLNTCIDTLRSRHSPLRRSISVPETTSRRNNNVSRSYSTQILPETPSREPRIKSAIRKSSSDARSTFSENLSDVETPVLDESPIAFGTCLKRSHERATSSSQTRRTSHGIAIFFTPYNVHISTKLDDLTETFAIPPFLYLEVREKTTVMVDYRSSNHGNPELKCVEVYPMVIKAERAKTREQLKLWSNGSKQWLWAEEILALFFTQIKNLVHQRWNLDVSKDHVAIGLPSSVPGVCKHRLRRALRYAGLTNNYFVQVTTAIGLFRMASPEEMAEHYELALYIQGSLLDVSLNKLNDRKLTVSAIHSCTEFVGLKTPLYELISRCLRDAIHAVLTKAGIHANQVPYCTCIIDTTDLSPDLKNVIPEIILNALPDQVRPSLCIEAVPDRLMDGLLHVSRHRSIHASSSGLYQEAFPYSIEVNGVEDAAEGKTKLVTDGVKSEHVTLTLWACKLGSSKSPTRIISYYSDGSNNEVKFHLPDELRETAPHTEVEITVNKEGMVAVRLKKSSSQYKLIKAVYNLPDEESSSAKSRLRTILTASGVPSTHDPPPSKRSKTL